LLNLIATEKPLITLSDIRNIFSSIDIIYGYNLMLLEELNRKMGMWTSKQKLADVFLFMGEFLKAYSDYISNYENAQSTLIICSENKSFAKFLERVSQDPICGGESLMSYLIMPVQRIPRYEILLKELERNTPEDHPDYENLKIALSKIIDINEYINEKKKIAESSFKLLEITDVLVGQASKVIQPHRKYISDYLVLFSSNETKLKKIQGRIYIFNDAIMYTRNSKKKGKQKIMKIISLFFLRKFMKWEGDLLVISSSSQDNIVFDFNEKKTSNIAKKVLNDALEVDKVNKTNLTSI